VILVTLLDRLIAKERPLEVSLEKTSSENARRAGAENKLSAPRIAAGHQRQNTAFERRH
jgi:hypothetical protein